MEQWSILSDNIVYVRSVGYDDMSRVDIKMVDYRDHKKMCKKMGKEGQMMNIDFGESSDVLKAKYMDAYEDVFAEVVTTNRFDENFNLSTTYLGKIDIKREDIMKAEETFLISEQGFVIGKVLNGEECQVLLDTGVSKSYMSTSYLRCKALHDLPKFPSKTQRIQVGNGQYVGVLFVILIIVEFCGHRLEVFTLVSEIFDNVDIVLGIKNIFGLEGVIDSCESCFRFLSRSIPIFPREQAVVKLGEKKSITIVTLFLEEILGMAIVKIIGKGQKMTMMLKLQFIGNKATLDTTNNTREILIFDRKTTIGILDLRSLCYYKIKQGVLQQSLNKYYHFEEANKVCKEFNKMIEVIKDEEGKVEREIPMVR